jgi:hypothetical protein
VKVRHKLIKEKYELVVVEESPSYYIVVGPQGEGAIAVEKHCYEPIPTETWRDVTSDCEAHNNGTQLDYFVHGEPGHYGIIRVMGNDNQRDGSFLPYRLRKVSVCREGGFTDCGKCNMFAFIVEKREP